MPQDHLTKWLHAGPILESKDMYVEKGQKTSKKIIKQGKNISFLQDLWL